MTLETIVDLHTITVTLLVPTVILPGSTEREVTLAAIETTRITTLVGPETAQGQLATYRPLVLTGRAQHFEF